MANYFHILIIICEQAIFRKAEITLMFVVMCMNSEHKKVWRHWSKLILKLRRKEVWVEGSGFSSAELRSGRRRGRYQEERLLNRCLHIWRPDFPWFSSSRI